MPRDTKPGHVWISAQVPKRMHDALNTLAHREDRTMSAEVRRAIRAHIDRAGGDNAKGGD